MHTTSLILRVSLLYICVLFLVRLSGKRSVGRLSPIDFVMAVIIGELIDHVLSAKVSVPQGLAAVVTLIAWHLLLSYATSHSRQLQCIFEDSKTPVILQGRFISVGLRRERTSPEDVLSELRLQKLDEDEIFQIQEASWERNGQLSVVLQAEARPAQKKDGSTQAPVHHSHI